MFEEMKEMFRQLKESGLHNEMSDYYKVFLDSLLDKGFSRDEAITLMINTSLK